jgi:Na+-transporting NADH:ubiquinone oxidoreductase subunit NqrA
MKTKKNYSFIKINTNQFIDELKKDLKSLEYNIKEENFALARHYCNGISELSKWISEYLDRIEKNLNTEVQK